MYRALIVEDEPLMRQYLLEKLPDIHPNWQAAAAAGDGLEAMSLMQRELFDLVITDIRMPGMDGLSLARYVAANHPSAYVIILSGYDEFDYARTAVRLNVCDYLLKPLNDGELNQALEKVSQRLAEAKRRLLRDSCFPVLFRDTMAGMPAKALAECTHQLGMRFHASGMAHWGVMVLAPNLLDAAMKEENTDLDELRQKLFGLAFDSFSGLAAMDGDGNTVVLTLTRDPILVATECQNGCSRISRTFQSGTGVSLLGGFSKARGSLDQLKPAYEEALDALWLAQAGDGPFLSGDLLYAKRTRLGLLKSLIETGRESVFMNSLQSASSLCLQAAASLGHPIRGEAFLMLGSFLLSRCFHPGKELEGIKLLLKNIPDEAASSAACAKAYESCLAIFYDDNKQAREETGPSPLIQKAQEYLHMHFRESVSLSMVADAFHVTPAYLSALFHKEVGESYSKFLTRIRMEHAAIKLKSDPSAKMYDVAKQVGFVSPKHFIHVFREFYGKTPKEYQELFLK